MRVNLQGKDFTVKDYTLTKQVEFQFQLQHDEEDNVGFTSIELKLSLHVPASTITEFNVAVDTLTKERGTLEFDGYTFSFHAWEYNGHVFQLRGYALKRDQS